MKGNIFKRWPWLLHLLLMVAVSVVILIVVFLFIRLYARQGQEYELPDMVGQQLEDVVRDNPIGLDFVVMDSVYRSGVKGGMVLTQDPRGATLVKRGRKVYVTVSSYNAEASIMPELAGLSVRQAVSELIGCGLVVGELRYVSDPYKNTIVEQSCNGRTVYAGQELPHGSVIDLMVALGDGTGSTVVPFVIGKNAERARRDIHSASLNVGKEHFRGVTDKDKAVVYKQEPDYTGVSRYDYGTRVELWYKDADSDEVEKMVRTFKVDSSKIVNPVGFDDGRPTPEQLDAVEDEIINDFSW